MNTKPFTQILDIHPQSIEEISISGFAQELKEVGELPLAERLFPEAELVWG